MNSKLLDYITHRKMDFSYDTLLYHGFYEHVLAKEQELVVSNTTFPS